MKLVPDIVTSTLGKVLPFGGSDEQESADPPARESEPASQQQTEAPFDAESDAAEASEGSTEEPADEPEAQSERDTSGPAAENEPHAGSEPDSSEESVSDPRGESEPEPEGGSEDEAEREPSGSEGADDEDSSPGDNDEPENDAENITAPSIGPNTVIENKPPEERLDHDKISKTDAFGLDKRRAVTGKRYSASPARQVVVYALFVVVVVAIVIGGKALATNLDEPPKQVENRAPWSGTEQPVDRLDFPKYGEPAS